jgi:hypothetical protein
VRFRARVIFVCLEVFQLLFMEQIMTTPLTLTALSPSIDVLAKCLERSSVDYQKLLSHAEAYSLCVEVGRSLRHIAGCYARVLCAALDYSEFSDDDSNEVDDEALGLTDDDVEYE